MAKITTTPLSRTGQRAQARRTQAAPRQAAGRWSAEVTRRSNALDLEPRVFARNDPKQIAASLKRSAEASARKKSDSFRSAMSMLNFYINRAGINLTDSRRRILVRAKDELRKQFKRA
jgi:predicted secreted protein